MVTKEQIEQARETRRQWLPGVSAEDFDPPMEADEAIEIMDKAYVEACADRDYYKELAQLYHDAVHKEAQRRAGVEI